MLREAAQQQEDESVALASVAQLVGALSSNPKGGGFHPWSEHMSRLWVHRDISLPLSLSKINEHVLG